MILQLNPPIQVKVSQFGMGWAFFIIDYGININTIWVVRIDESGEIKHFDSNDVKIEGNPMLGIAFLK